MGQVEAAISQSLSGWGLALFIPKFRPCGWFVGARGERMVGCWWLEAAAGWDPAFLTLSGVQGGPIASPLEPLLLALQPTGPLEEGLSLFFKNH